MENQQLQIEEPQFTAAASAMKAITPDGDNISIKAQNANGKTWIEFNSLRDYTIYISADVLKALYSLGVNYLSDKISSTTLKTILKSLGVSGVSQIKDGIWVRFSPGPYNDSWPLQYGWQ
jgi:ribosomal protein L28